MYPFNATGIPVEQPFGPFVIALLPARILLDTAYSDRLTATRSKDGSYRLSGSQRAVVEPRLKDIGKFIETGAACFPNSIILAANYREEDGLEEEDENLRWTFAAKQNAQAGVLRIPKAIKRAAIIDGQHRLFGFNYTSKAERLEMPLVCAVFFDLPKPYQARLFATINANQRPVNKSQTYELFGYNVEEEPAKKWTPEKLAVFMARKLNAEKSSPFHQHIVVPAENDFSPSLAGARRVGDWAVSMATVVEGTLRLISTNPKRDAYRMAGEVRYEGHDRSALDPANDIERTPLRELYRECNDEMIHTALNNYFAAVDHTLWRDAPPETFIRKTVGVQALFDISRRLLFEGVRERDLRVPRFMRVLDRARRIDFGDPFFHASGASRSTIRKTLEFAINETAPSQDDPNFKEYCRLLKR
jgi:DNA phosphorothioation-associated DGQHR protein 1